MSVQGFVMSLMHGATGKDAAKALILPNIFGEAVGNQSYPVVESSGSSPLEIENAAAKDMLSFKTNIVPTQDLHGQSAPWPVGGGVNKFGPNANALENSYIGIAGNIATGEAAQGWTVSDYISVAEQTEYTFAPHSTEGYSAKAWFYDTNKTGISYIDSGPRTFTTPADCAYMRFSYRSTSYDIQLELGSSVSATYTPYSNICPIVGWETIHGYVSGKQYGDYILLDYLDSNGSQYINTGIVPFEGFGFECTFYTNSDISASSFGCLFGGRTSSGVKDYQATSYSVGSDQGTIRYGDTSHQVSAKISKETKQTIKLQNNVYTAPDGTTATINEQTFTDVQYPIYVHALNNAGTAVQGGLGCRIYDLIIYNGNVVYRHFIPCMRSSDSELGYYETITGTFFTNQGEGTFTAGHVKESTTIPVTFGALGANQWDEEVTLGGINNSGELTDSTATIRSKNKIFVNASTEYRIVVTGGIGIFEYASDDTFIKKTSFASSGNLTTSASTAYLRIGFGSQYGTTYLHNVGVNLPASVTSYEPYNATVYSGNYDFVSGEGESSDPLIEAYGLSWTGHTALNDGTGYYVYKSSMFTSTPTFFMSDTYKLNNTSSGWGSLTFGECRATTYLIVTVPLECDTLDKAKAWLNEHNPKFFADTYYESPTSFTCDPTDIKLLSGTNYLWSDCGNTISATYQTKYHAEDITLTGVSPLLLANSQAKKMSQCEIGIVATQEGSGDPYPAGGGVNKLDAPDITLSGAGYIFNKTVSLSAGTYTLSMVLPSGVGSISLAVAGADGDYINSTVAIPITFTVDGEITNIRAYASSTGTYKNIQLEEGSSATAWKPYSNIRPIHGVSTLSTTIADNSSGTGGTTYSTVFGCLGVNQWDEEWQVGIYGTNGQYENRAGYLCSINPIPVKPSTDYYIVSDSKSMFICEYDADNVFIQRAGYNQRVFTTSATTRYLQFNMQQSYGDEYANNLSINYPSSVTTYQPYVNEVFGGTFNELTSGLGQTWGAVVLNGSETWGGGGAHGMYTEVDDVIRRSDYTSSIMCEDLKVFSNHTGASFTSSDYGITAYSAPTSYPGQNWIYIAAAGCTTTTGLKAWLAQNPVKVVFELATPIPRQYEPHSPESLAGHTYVISNGGGNITATYKGVDLS